MYGLAVVSTQPTFHPPCTHTADEAHPPVKAGDFTEKLALLRANDDEALEDEYAVSVWCECVCVCVGVGVCGCVCVCVCVFGNIACKQLP